MQLRCRGSWSEGSGEPLSECVPGLRGGRAAGDDRAETPGPLLRRRSCVGGVPGQPVPAAGLSEFRRGSCAGGAGWGGSTVHSAVSGCCAAALFFVEMPIFPAFPRAALRLREHLPDGVAASGWLILSGSAARAFAAAARSTGAAPTGWRSSSQLTPPTASAGGCRGGRSLLPCAWSGVTKERECPPGTPSCCFQRQTGRWSVRSGAVPRPHWVKSHISDTCSTVGSQHRGFTPVPPFHGISGASLV